MADEVRIQHGGMSATVILPSVTPRDVTHPDSAIGYIARLAQRGKDVPDRDKRFYSTMIENYPAEISSFFVCVSYDVTLAYYKWIERLRHKALSSGNEASTSGPIRFEHDVIDLGVTSNTWHAFVYDDVTDDLLMKYSFKNVRMNLAERKPIKNPDYAEELLGSFRETERYKKIQNYPELSSFSIPKDKNFLSKFKPVFTKQWTIKERNIDGNQHTNYLVYVNWAMKTLTEALATMPNVRRLFVKHLSVLFEGESLLGDKLDVSVCFEDGMFQSTEQIEAVVTIETENKRIVVCRFELVELNRLEQHNTAKL